MKSPQAATLELFENNIKKDRNKMSDTTATEFFKLIKHHIEQELDRNGWRWATGDSRFLDWCLMNIEDTHGNRR